MAVPTSQPTGDIKQFITTLRPNNNAQRYPAKDDIDTPLDGFYVCNESTTNPIFVNWDQNAKGDDTDLFIPANDFRNVGAKVEKFISVFATSLTVVNVIGYRRSPSVT